MDLLWEDIVKLLIAVLVGGLIGAEREYHDKAAGFRTLILISLGSTLFTIFSLRLSGNRGDPARIAAAIVSGVGFLGAGAILRSGERVIGLTTASTIWLAAALGMGIGGGDYLLVGVAALLVLVVLILFPKIELWLDRLQEVRTYEVTGPTDLELFEELEGTIAGCGLRIAGKGRVRAGDEMVFRWRVFGSPEAHEQLATKLASHAQVRQFKA